MGRILLRNAGQSDLPSARSYRRLEQRRDSNPPHFLPVLTRCAPCFSRRIDIALSSLCYIAHRHTQESTKAHSRMWLNGLVTALSVFTMLFRFCINRIGTHVTLSYEPTMGNWLTSFYGEVRRWFLAWLHYIPYWSGPGDWPGVNPAYAFSVLH